MRLRTRTFYDIVHVLQNTKKRELRCIFDHFYAMHPKSYRIRWNNAKRSPLRSSGSFKVTDFDTDRKLIYIYIYDFLLVINNNLPPILHSFQVMAQFSLARGECLTLTLSLGVIPCQYCRKWYIAKTRFFGLHFCRRECRCIFNHFT